MLNPPIIIITLPKKMEKRMMKKQKKDVKLFCAVYTYSGGINNTNAIRDTWGKRCDGLLFASDHSS